MNAIHRSKVGTTILLTLGLSLAAGLFSAGAWGVAWKSASNPLIAYEGGVAQAKAYGNYYNDGSVSAMSTSYQYDIKAGGNNVRVETDFYFWEPNATCNGGGSCWHYDTSKQTTETDSASWVKYSRARNLHGGASGTRGGINVCEIQAWSNDPCSAHAYPSFNY